MKSSIYFAILVVAILACSDAPEIRVLLPHPH